MGINDPKSEKSSKAFGALLTNLSKAFDCLDQELLNAKLSAYGFSIWITYQTGNNERK